MPSRHPTTIARLAAVALLAPILEASAATWPAEERWVPLEQGGLPLEDPAGDAPSPVDIAGPEGEAAGAWYVDEAWLYLRFRSPEPPGPSWADPDPRYGVLFDLDGDPIAYELSALLRLSALSLHRNTAGSVPGGWSDPPDGASTTVSSNPVGDDLVRVREIDGGWALDLALPLSDLEGLGFDRYAPPPMALATGSGGGLSMRNDLAGADNAPADGAAPVLEDGLCDPPLFDADADGLNLGAELAFGTDPLVADTDGDGILDGDEARCPDWIYPDDRDGDAVADALEGIEDTDRDGLPDFCDPDDDNDGWDTLAEGTGDTDDDGTPDHRDTDADGDGTPDIDEAEDHDCDGILGRIDEDDEDGPCGDRDGDGMPSDEELDCGSDPDRADTDGDGLLDGAESCDDDSDGDGVLDIFDPTDDPSDADGVLTEDGEIYGFSGGSFGGGGGCSTVPGQTGLLTGLLPVLLVLLALTFGRARPGSVLLLLLFASPLARAQELDAQRHRPAMGEDDFLVVQDAERGPAGPGLGLHYNLAKEPFVYRVEGADGEHEDTPLLDRVGTLDLLAWGELGPVRMGVDLPLHLVSKGYGVDLYEERRLGDVALDLQVGILDPDKQALGLAVHLRGSAPTGEGHAWTGDVGPTALGELVTSVGERVLGMQGSAAANLGFLWAQPEVIGDLELGSRLTWGLGATAWPLSWWGFGLEHTGEHILPAAAGTRRSPMELISSMRLRPRPGLVAGLGLGSGLTGGLGAPRHRVVLSISAWPLHLGREPAP